MSQTRSKQVSVLSGGRSQSLLPFNKVLGCPLFREAHMKFKNDSKKN